MSAKGAKPSLNNTVTQLQCKYMAIPLLTELKHCL